jgi:hypothetical protein
MTISQILVTTWLVLSVGQAVHDDYAQRRSEASAQTESLQLPVADEAEPVLEQESSDSERRRQGWFNCWSRDSPRRWTSAKKRYCCNNFSVVEQLAMPQAKGNCRRSANDFTPGGEYNCNSGRPSSWTAAKARFCCRTQGKGCRRNSGGPSIGGRRLEESDSSENYYDDELDLESDLDDDSFDYYDDEFDLESDLDQASESADYYDEEFDLESDPDQASLQ